MKKQKMTGSAHDAANVHLYGKPPSPYICPRHGVPLVRRVVALSQIGRRALGLSKVEFWQCPVWLKDKCHPENTGRQCSFCKPCKYQKGSKRNP